ncbi:FecR family protein [Arenibacter nanhaiticus]|uniref:FecR family protein n=1 Tax=Arenibacter nanhaiticus TaxID=558155 RepID=A0A1M6M7S3_9FLAO|nr:FecR domain-containing protein [Arenibacter nanhaiticus]SHJ79525.1 FecR family protein [Arenibacter nanhaiticus]
MKKIIIKYLNEEISKEELQLLSAWVKKPENQETFKSYVQINHKLNKTYQKVDADKAYKKILDQLDDVHLEKRPQIIKISSNWLRYAAVFIGFLLIGVVLIKKLDKEDSFVSTSNITLELEDGSIQIVHENQNTVIVDSLGLIVSEQKENELIYFDKVALRGAEEKEPHFNILKVPYGKTFGIALSDGSKITLNAGSQLKYPVHFVKGKKRSVILNGEAYFDIAKDTEHPFVVNTKDMDIQVLGTQFNVTSYTQDEKTYTVLVEGKVAAKSKLQENDSIILSPNQRVFFEEGYLKHESVKIEKYVGWLSGQLVFIDDSFAVIAHKLERKFDLKIVNEYPALDDITITATFKDQDIHEILKTFQTYLPFKYTIKNGTVTITEPDQK